MKPTPEQKVQIRLLSDGQLYDQAVTFVKQNDTVENKQMAGLLEFSRSWQELLKFVRHQKGRDWQRKKAHYADFYTQLEQQLEQLRAKVKSEYGMVPHGLTKKETSRHTEYFAGLLAREFIQHLVAEMMWKEKGLS